MDLSTLYESKDNPLFQKMVKYLMENNPRLVDELQDYIPLLMSKFSDLCGTIESLISQNNVSKEWDIEKLEQLLSFQLDTVYSLYKLLKVFPQVAENFLRHPNFVNGYAKTVYLIHNEFLKVQIFVNYILKI
jgi:ABC-type transporter Mla subunit MlaD